MPPSHMVSGWAPGHLDILKQGPESILPHVMGVASVPALIARGSDTELPKPYRTASA